jgi:DNA mismatch endonuclease, patch repair protein
MEKEKRSKIMRSIRGRDTRPELIVRKLLFARGFRYRIHYKKLPGKPDIVLPKYRAIILVNGCFWHGHDCHIFKPPRQDAWRQKIRRNKERDEGNLNQYHLLNWKTLIVWECALQGKEKLGPLELSKVLESWVIYDPADAEIAGRGRSR